MQLQRPVHCIFLLLFGAVGPWAVFAQTADGTEFQLAVAHALQKVRRDGADLASLDFSRRVQLEAARDETESFQLVVVPAGKPLKSVAVTAGPLGGREGRLEVNWRRVSYVRTGNPSYPVEHVGWWPDPLMPPGPFDLADDRVQPLWFTASIPAEARPGVYRGKVVVESAGERQSVSVTLRVRNFALPRPGALATPFGLYKSQLSRWYGEPVAVKTFARWCEFLGRYRLTPKNIGYEYVNRVGKTTHSGRKVREVDMSQLDSTVGELAPKYFAPYSFGLYRLPSAPTFLESQKEQSRRWDVEAVAGPVTSHVREWKRRGFPEDVYVYGVDEPVGDELLAFLSLVYGRIKQAGPGLKIMQTLGHDKAEHLIGLVDIWCPKTTAVRSSFYAERRKAGDTLWNYVCVSPIPPCANFFIDEPAIDHRVLFWQTRQVGAAGLLYWTTVWYNGLPSPASGEPCFPDAPIDMTLHEMYTSSWVHVNGDGLLVYPGKSWTPLPSIRLEVIRDGIEDYEYFALLDKLISKVKKLPKYQSAEGISVVRAAEALSLPPTSISRGVNDFTKDPVQIFKRCREIGDMIEQLTHVLEAEDWKKWK